MGKRTEAATRWILFTVLLVPALTGATVVEAGDQPASWCSFLSSPPRAGTEAVVLVPRQAQYDVDVLGNAAIGTLNLEFANTGIEDRAFKLSARRPDGMRLDSLTVEFVESGDSRPLEYAFVKSNQRGNLNRGRQATDPQQVFTSDSLEIAADEAIRVKIAFTLFSKFEQDRFALTLPVAGGSCVPDAAGVPEGSDAVAPLSVSLRIRHDQPLELAESPSHDVLIEFEGDHTVAELVAPDPLGVTPFEFRYALGRADEPVLSGFATPATESGERDVLLVFSPSVAPSDDTVRPKEVLFVFDTSGSMRGPKIQIGREALTACLARLHEFDRFNMIEFDGSFTTLFDDPQEVSATALEASATWLASQKAAGSTTLMPALAAAFEQERSSEHHRLVVVLTDGAIGDQAKVLQFLRETLGEARLFFVGVGAEPNREAVRRLAEYGRGTAAFANDPEEFGLAVQQLFEGISAPLAWDISVDWSGAEVVEMQPRRVPDLYVGRPVTIEARVRGELPPTLVLQATTTGGVRTFEAVTPTGGAQEFPNLRGISKPGASGAKRRTGTGR